MLGHMYERPWSVDSIWYGEYFQEAARLQGLAWKLADWVHLCSRATMLGLFPKMCPCFLPNAIFVNIFAIRLRSHRMSDNGQGTLSSLVNKIEDGFRFVFFLQHNPTIRQDVIQLDNSNFVFIFLGDQEIEKRDQPGSASIIPFQRYRKRKRKRKRGGSQSCEITG